MHPIPNYTCNGKRLIEVMLRQWPFHHSELQILKSKKKDKEKQNWNFKYYIEKNYHVPKELRRKISSISSFQDAYSNIYSD